jgi:hypothetical protein
LGDARVRHFIQAAAPQRLGHKSFVTDMIRSLNHTIMTEERRNKDDDNVA